MATDKVVIDIVSKDKTNKGIKKAENSFKKMGKAIGPLIALGFGVAAIKNATDAYIRQENAIAQLEARLKSTKNAVGISSKGLQDMAASLQQVTTFGDEAIIEMQSLLLTFTKVGEETFPQATEAILNMSTAMGQDLKTSAIQVGKALNDPVAGIAAMSRSGIQFTDVQKDMIKELTKSGDLLGAQTIILKELETQFGGAARAAKDTLGGALQSLSNAFGDVQEQLGASGTGFIPFIKQLEEILTSKELHDGIDLVASGIGNIGASLILFGRAHQEGAKLLDFIDLDAITDFTPIIRDVKELMRVRREALAGKLTAAPERPEGGFISSAEQAARNSRVEAAETEAAQILDIQREAGIEQNIQQQAIDDRRVEQLRMLMAANKEQYAEDVENKKQASDLKEQNERMAAAAGMQALANLSSLMNSESRKAFEIGKIAAIATTTIDTFQSATSSFKALSGIPIVGPALGAAAAAAAIAAGLANVQSISSQQFQGGGGGQPAVPNINTGNIGPQAQTVAQPQATLEELGGANIEVRTGSILGVWVEEELIPAVNEATRRGVTLVIA